MTENGYGKRTRVSDYPVKGRGGLGVKTIQLTDARGKLAGARVVRDGYQVMLISTGGTVIRIPVEEIKRLGRSTQGVIVMRLRGDEEKVSSLALVMEGADSDYRRRRGCRRRRGGRHRAARGAGLRRGRVPRRAGHRRVARTSRFLPVLFPNRGKSVYMLILRGRRIRR